MEFHRREYFRVNLTPAQLAGMVDAFNNLVLTDEEKQLWLRMYHVKRPFAVFYPQNAHAPAVICYPGDGQLDANKRDPRHGWIDVIERANDASEVVSTYNVNQLDMIFRLSLWQLLFNWLEECGAKIWSVDAEDAEAADAATAYQQTTTPIREALPHDLDSAFSKLWLDDSLTKEEIMAKLAVGMDWINTRAYLLRLPPRKRGRKKSK